MNKNNIIEDIVERDLDNWIRTNKMIGWQRERIIKTYSRKVAANDDKQVVHDGDCSIYNDRLGVCTCGLHHCLIASGKDVIDELYPKFYEEEDNQGLIALMLDHFEHSRLYAKGGSDFFRVKRPPTLQMTMDEILEIVKNKNDLKGKDDD